MRRALTVDNIYNTKRDMMQFDGEWLEVFGCPEIAGSWIIWGDSGHGKTSFVLQLCKYLTKFGRVAYDTLEQGNSASFAMALKEHRMQDVKGKFIVLDKEPMPELIERLALHKSPDIVVIDSFQYSELTYKEYKRLKDAFRNKLFIIISHAEGKLPYGKPAKSVRFDADIKIRVEGFRAFPMTRLGGRGHFTIWQEGADNYWGTDI
jgi:hypothetical protein